VLVVWAEPFNWQMLCGAQRNGKARSNTLAATAEGAVEPTRVVAGANDHRRRARHFALARRPRIDLSRNIVGHAGIDFHFLARVGVACAEELDHMGLSAESAALQLPPGVGDQIGAAKGLRSQDQSGSRGNDQQKHGRSKGRPHVRELENCAQYYNPLR
jgi:hypothetical protein